MSKVTIHGGCGVSEIAIQKGTQLPGLLYQLTLSASYTSLGFKIWTSIPKENYDLITPGLIKGHKGSHHRKG